MHTLLATIYIYFLLCFLFFFFPPLLLFYFFFFVRVHSRRESLEGGIYQGEEGGTFSEYCRIPGGVDESSRWNDVETEAVLVYLVGVKEVGGMTLQRPSATQPFSSVPLNCNIYRGGPLTNTLPSSFRFCININ